MPNLFQQGEFTLHSGMRSGWKVDCDALTEEDWETIAAMIADVFSFCKVVGVPTGGKKLKIALRKYEEDTSLTTLIVDDVFTTGESMELYRNIYSKYHCIGVVLFARGKCPAWITPIWQLNDEIVKEKAIDD